MNFNSPKSEPKKSVETFNAKKVEKTEIASKPNQKPNDKPKNKIERQKIDIKKEPRNKIQREKINLLTPPRNKIERPKIDLKTPPRNKIERSKIDLNTPPRNKIEPPKFDPKAPPKYKIPHQRDDVNKSKINPIHSAQNRSKLTLRLEKIKEEIKKVEWGSISDDWSITTHSNQYINALDPTENPSLENPLYRNKEWLNFMYNNKNWNLTNKKIANLCGVHPSTISQWRKRHQIPEKKGNCVNISNDNAQGIWHNIKTDRIWVAMSKDYLHPELKPLSGGGYIRPDHTFKMEKYLANNPQLELSKKYLIQGKYLKKGIEIHHINQIKQDNRIKNLWIYGNKIEHAKGELTLYKGLKTLICKNNIQFSNGKYFLNPDIDSLKTNTFKLGVERKREVSINYKDLNLIKEEIKKIDWNSISTDWAVQVKKNQFVQKTVIVDPTRDCSKENPLHHHKEWLRRIVSDNRFNLTDSRLAKLCGFSRDTARYWRERVHGIKGKTEWGYERRVDESDGRIWIKVPKDYANPVVQKEDHHRRIMLEHRYVIEQHLTKHPELGISKKCLIDGKYLKTEAHVHHINLDYQDNRTENLWVFENVKEHNLTTKSLYNLVEELLNSGKIRFKEGKYHTDA